ncbi:MAG: oligoendopeptidase F [Spirochaetes bacterium]|jgi:oligoendopeptidase F|nr:oligoendopeptidase F [Spirochaetota bacterium]
MGGGRIPERKEIPAADRWDLSPLFRNDAEWEALFSDIEKRMDGYATFRGRIGGSLDAFRDAIGFDLGVSRKAERLYTYAHLRSDEDKTDQFFLAMHDRAVNLLTRISEASSFMSPEIQAIPDEKMTAFLDDPSMLDYRFHLQSILRYKPHTLPEEIEMILAMSGEVAQAPSQIFGQLDNADMKFGELEDGSGKRVELSHGNFSSFLINPSRELREKAFFQYYASYEAHKNTIAASLSHSIKKDHFYSRVRKFESCRRAALFSDDVSDEVYDSLLESVKKNLAPLFRYLGFRKKVLGLDELHFYDTYVPIIGDVDFKMPYGEAVRVCVSALRPLGEEYCGVLEEGLLGGWVDRYENRGKRSGAYSSGCYDSPPYILMNYREDNINSLYTLIHEAGHSMHSYYSKKNQPFVNADYTIFVAEVASTFNEVLLSRHLLDLYRDDPGMTAYILNREIDDIRGTLFRQTMFAEFEKIIHGIVEENGPLTLETLTGAYGSLLETYFGGSMVIDEVLKLECLRIPHFYSDFYVYKYATGISAAIALSEKLFSGGEPARKSYLGFLGLGGSMFPIDELVRAGVDMRTPAPVDNAIGHFSGLVDSLIGAFEKMK